MDLHAFGGWNHTRGMKSLVDLLSKDGLKVADLERIYTAYGNDHAFIASAISAMRQLDADLAWRAVWLLKRAARDHRLSTSDVARIATYAEELPHWASRVTLCQLFDATGCPADVRERLLAYLVECFGNRRPMIRAWAVSAMRHMDGDPEFQDTIEACRQQARADPAGSVQARLRRLGRNHKPTVRRGAPRRPDAHARGAAVAFPFAPARAGKVRLR